MSNLTESFAADASEAEGRHAHGTMSDALLEELRGAGLELEGVLEQTKIVPGAAAKIRASYDEVDRHLAREELEILVVGKDLTRRRAFINTVVGESLLPTEVRAPKDARILVRHGSTANYRARLCDARVVDFAMAMPDRTDSFDKALVRAEDEKRSADEVLAETRARLDGATTPLGHAARLTDPAVSAGPPRRLFLALRIFWHAIVALLGRAFRRVSPRLLPPPRDALKFERDVAAASAKVEHASRQIDRVRAEREKYAEERRREYASDVRSFADGGGRGIELAELVVEYPCRYLPAGFALVEAPVSPSADYGGCVVVDDGEPPGTPDQAADEESSDLDSKVEPLVPSIVGGVVSLVPALRRMRAEWPVVVAARAAVDVLAHVHHVVEEAVRIDIRCRAAIAELERQRLPDPLEFRKRLIASMADAIETGSREVESKTFELLRAGTEEVKAEWSSAVEACRDRSAIEACVERLKETSSARFVEMLEKLGVAVLNEMQRVSEALQVHALEAVRAQYKSRRVYEDEASPVVIDMPDEIASLSATPLGTAMAAFESRRVEMGLGGAVAGATLGTAIFPGVGTALGALIGVFAGFMEGTTALKSVCISKAHAHVDEVETQISKRFEASAKEFAGDIRLSIEDALERALRQRETSIFRLIDVEGKALEREQLKLAQVTGLLAALRRNEKRLSLLQQETRRVLRGPACPDG